MVSMYSVMFLLKMSEVTPSKEMHVFFTLMCVHIFLGSHRQTELGKKRMYINGDWAISTQIFRYQHFLFHPFNLKKKKVILRK